MDILSKIIKIRPIIFFLQFILLLMFFGKTQRVFAGCIWSGNFISGAETNCAVTGCAEDCSRVTMQCSSPSITSVTYHGKAWCDPSGKCIADYYNCDCSTDYCGGGSGDSCFLPGTKIKMESGEKNIEEVKQGDKVVSVDPKTGLLTENTVNSLHITSQDHYYTITTASGKVIKATDEHPFYTGDKSAVQKSLTQKVQATASILYIYLQDGWQVAKQKMGIKV